MNGYRKYEKDRVAAVRYVLRLTTRAVDLLDPHVELAEVAIAIDLARLELREELARLRR